MASPSALGEMSGEVPIGCLPCGRLSTIPTLSPSLRKMEGDMHLKPEAERGELGFWLEQSIHSLKSLQRTEDKPSLEGKSASPELLSHRNFPGEYKNKNFRPCSTSVLHTTLAF